MGMRWHVEGELGRNEVAWDEGISRNEVAWEGGLGRDEVALGRGNR